MTETNTIAAGIDTAKHKLDVAIHDDRQRWQFDNGPVGFRDLVRLLRRRKVSRVGIEATGGYEREAVVALRKAGFAVVVLQPIQVRGFAQAVLCRAKSDSIDAGLIAACVAHREVMRPPPDPRMVPLADLLTFIEQTEEDIARCKVLTSSASPSAGLGCLPNSRPWSPLTMISPDAESFCSRSTVSASAPHLP